MRTQSATLEKLLATMNSRHYWTIESLTQEYNYSIATTRKVVAEAINNGKVVTEKMVGRKTLIYWLSDTYKRKIAARRAYQNRRSNGIVQWTTDSGFDPYILYTEDHDLDLDLDRVVMPVIPTRKAKDSSTRKVSETLGYQYNDGGRALAGRKGSASDCVVRAIAIATKLPYATVRQMLIDANTKVGRKVDPDKGNLFTIYAPILYSLGWSYSPLYGKVNKNDLPSGTIIAIATHHAIAVIDHVMYDTWNPSKRGTKKLRGYFYQRTPQVQAFPVKQTSTVYASSVTFVTYTHEANK